MLSDFINGLETFQKECNEMPDEEFLAPFLEMGIEFVDIEESKTRIFDEKQLLENMIYKIVLQKNRTCPKQLIA